MNPTHYNLPRAKLGILERKFHMMTIPILAKSSSLTNDSYKDLHYIIKTLKDEPDVEDITKLNFIQWDKEQIVPVLDGNGCAVTVSRVKVEKEKMVFNESKYKIGIRTWLNQNITKLYDDGKANTSYRENKIKTSVQMNYQPVKLQNWKEHPIWGGIVYNTNKWSTWH